MLRSYYKAVDIVDALYTQEILAKKIQLNFVNENATNARLYNHIGSIVAAAERSCQFDMQEPSQVTVACDFYFYDLNLFGDKWEHADLKGDFEEIQRAAYAELSQRDGQN